MGCRDCLSNKGVWAVVSMIVGLLILLLLGVVAPSVLPGVLREGLDNQLIFSPDRPEESSFKWYQSSRSSGAPQNTIRFWVLSLLNVEDWIENGALPRVEERGPYAFIKHTERIDLRFGVDELNRKTMSFYEWTYLLWSPENSGPGLLLDDIHTVISPVFLGAAATVLPLLPDILLSYYPSANFTNSSRLIADLTVRQMLFGYVDTSFGRNLNYPGVVPNATREQAIARGRTVVYTGEGDNSLTRQLKTYQSQDYWYANVSLLPLPQTPQLVWNTLTANRIAGTDGQQFRRGLKAGDNIPAVNPDTMRAVNLRNMN